MSFLTPLILAADPQPDMWIIDTSLIWDDPIYGTITVPKGFRTDLASIPRFLRGISFLDPNGVSRRPAAVHDWLYALQRDKRRADNFLRDSLLAEGANQATAHLFYYGVHWFGGPAWESDAGRIFTSKDFDTQQDFIAWFTRSQQ